uniref:hypothetical protein n=1 Tax=Clavibacter michiganensis TaxID=28447 RepID=UPI002930A533
VLVIANFNRTERVININISVELLTQFGLSGAHNFTDLLSGATFNSADIHAGIPVSIPASSGLLLNL